MTEQDPGVKPILPRRPPTKDGRLSGGNPSPAFTVKVVRPIENVGLHPGLVMGSSSQASCVTSYAVPATLRVPVLEVVKGFD